MASDEDAKAIQEAAKATGKIADISRPLVDLFVKITQPAGEQIGGLVADVAAYARIELQARLARRVEALRREHGISDTFRRVPLNVAIPLLRAATIEEDADLQDTWARMLLNAANADSAADVRHKHVSILENLGTLEVQILAAIHSAPKDARERHGVWTNTLPDRASASPGVEAQLMPAVHVQESLWSLVREGVIAPGMTWGGLSVVKVKITPLGDSFIRACTLPCKNVEGGPNDPRKSEE